MFAAPAASDGGLRHRLLGNFRPEALAACCQILARASSNASIAANGASLHGDEASSITVGRNDAWRRVRALLAPSLDLAVLLGAVGAGVRERPGWQACGGGEAMAEMLPATSRESAPGQAREGARGAQSTMDKTCEPEDKMYACDREPMLNWPRLAAGLVSQMQAFVCAWRALPLPVQRRLQDEKLRLPLDDAVTRLGRSRRSRHSPGGPQTGTDVRRSLAPPRWPPAGAEASDVLRTASISGCAAADTSMLAAGSSGRGMVDGAFSTRRTAPLSDLYRQQLPAGGFWQSVNVTLDRGGVAPRLQAVDAQGHALCLVCLERVRGGPVVQPAQHRRSSAAGATSSTPPQGNADACGPQLDVASCAAGATSSTPPRTRSPPAGAQGSGANTSGPQQSQLTHADLSSMCIDACGCHLRRRYFAEELDAAAAVDCYARLRGEPCPNFPHGKAARSLTLQEVSCDVDAIDCSRRHGLAVGMSQRNRNLNHMTKPVSC